MKRQPRKSAEQVSKGTTKRRRERESNITVVVRRAGPMDPAVFDAWCKRYVLHVLEVYRADCIAAGEPPPW